MHGHGFRSSKDGDSPDFKLTFSPRPGDSDDVPFMHGDGFRSSEDGDSGAEIESGFNEGIAQNNGDEISSSIRLVAVVEEKARRRRRADDQLDLSWRRGGGWWADEKEWVGSRNQL